jgi:molecular chaperone Hsp33
MGKIVKALLDLQVLAIACDSTDICEDARKIHDLTPVMSAVLGRTMTAGLIMSSRLKHDADTLTLSIRGNGPAGMVTVVADADLKVKGYVENPAVDLPPTQKGKLDVSGAVGGEGYLSVIRDTGEKEPYTGMVSLASGEIAEDIAKYFAESEQQPCVVFLTVIVEKDLTVAKAGGLALMPLPLADEETLNKLESLLPRIQELGRMMREMPLEEALKDIFADMQLEILEERQADYYCACKRERLEKVIISLGREEIDDILEKDKQAEVICRFCRKKYVFSEEDLRLLLTSASSSLS